MLAPGVYINKHEAPLKRFPAIVSVQVLSVYSAFALQIGIPRL